MAGSFGNFISSLNPFGGGSGTPFNAFFGENGLISNGEGAWDNFINGKTNEINKAIADENLEYQREALEKNLGFQYENLDYQKALQKEIFNREDTAYKRTVEDMRSAGLNPLTMQGTNGAGEAIQTEAPHVEALHNDFQYQGAGISQVMQAIGQIANQFQDFQVGTQVSKSNALQIERQKIENKFYEANQMADYLDKLESLRQKGLINDDLYRELNHRIQTNLYTTDPKTTSEIKGIVENIPDIAEGSVEAGKEAIKKTGKALYEAGKEGIEYLQKKKEEAEKYLKEKRNKK